MTPLFLFCFSLGLLQNSQRVLELKSTEEMAMFIIVEHPFADNSIEWIAEWIADILKRLLSVKLAL